VWLLVLTGLTRLRLVGLLLLFLLFVYLTELILIAFLHLGNLEKLKTLWRRQTVLWRRIWTIRPIWQIYSVGIPPRVPHLIVLNVVNQINLLNFLAVHVVMRIWRNGLGLLHDVVAAAWLPTLRVDRGVHCYLATMLVILLIKLLVMMLLIMLLIVHLTLVEVVD